MGLTDKAQELASYLAQAWQDGIVESYFELVDVTAGHAKTIQVAPGLGVLKDDEFTPPSLGVLLELANYSDRNLVRVSEGLTSNKGRKWKVQLGKDLLDDHSNIKKIQQARKTPVDTSSWPSFFISYKRYDVTLTEQLASYLRRVYGFDQVWYDKGIYAGQKWWNEIISQLSRRDILIYVMSTEALGSVYCRAEFTEAWRLGKQVICLLLRGASSPSALNEFQYVPLPNGDLTVESLVEIFATVVQQKADVLPVAPESQWAMRSIRPIGSNKMQVTVKVFANRDPGHKNDQPYCNTGILLVPGDEIAIKAEGEVTVDSRQTWYTPYGVISRSVNSDFVLHVHPRSDAYQAIGYPTEIRDVGNTGVVGSLIGWIQNDTMGLDKAFVVGSNLSKTINKGEEGFLYLAVNDTAYAYSDNEESFDVSIEIVHSG